MRSRWLLAPVLSFSIIAACSSSSSSSKSTTTTSTDAGSGTNDASQTGASSGTIGGDENGNPITVASVLAIYGSQKPSGSPQTNYAVIFFSSHAMTCDDLKNDVNDNVKYASTDALTLRIEIEASSTSETPPPITAAKYAASEEPSTDESGNIDVGFVAFGSTDASCNVANGDIATGGSVTLTAASATAVTGTFSLTMNSGATLTGSFTPAMCDATLADVTSNALEDAGPVTCKQ